VLMRVVSWIAVYAQPAEGVWCLWSGVLLYRGVPEEGLEDETQGSLYCADGGERGEMRHARMKLPYNDLWDKVTFKTCEAVQNRTRMGR
jgi:hypothetical protein